MGRRLHWLGLAVAVIDVIQRDLGFNPAMLIDEGLPRFGACYRDYHGV